MLHTVDQNYNIYFVRNPQGLLRFLIKYRKEMTFGRVKLLPMIKKGVWSILFDTYANQTTNHITKEKKKRMLQTS